MTDYERHINQLIQSVEKPKKNKKPRYKKPTAIKELEYMYFNWRMKTSSLPPYAIPKAFFRDDTATG